MKAFRVNVSRALMIVAALCVLLSAPSHAQATPEVFDTLSEEKIVEIMKAEGYTVELEPGDKDTDPDVLWKLDGSNCLIFTYDKGHSIQFYVGFTDTDATLRKVNEWNRTKRFSRSYLDDEDGSLPGIGSRPGGRRHQGAPARLFENLQGILPAMA